MRRTLICALIGLAASNTLSAALVTFTLNNQPGVFDGKTTAMLTVSGLTATFNATGGTLNSNDNTFGVDGAGADIFDQIEAGESLSVSFDSNVSLVGLNLNNFGPSESMNLTIGSNAFQTLNSQSAAEDLYTFNSNNFVGVGESVIFAPNVGAFSIRSFTVDTNVTAVPEPVASTFLIAAFVGCVIRTRKGIGRQSGSV